ncbi:MAG: hypothetical protein A2X49_00535 [Lentisphaerae bacterium GWF2_52_8]|nr:MAG: hypothetical protein A2X49_00535 [Lentisphaerae bacterium GWF2_52_8]
MPIYEFECLSCGREFDELVRNAGQAVECCKCSSKKIRKKMSVFGFSGGGRTKTSDSGHSCSSCSGGNCGSC